MPYDYKTGNIIGRKPSLGLQSVKPKNAGNELVRKIRKGKK